MAIGSESINRFSVTASDYFDHLTDQALLSVTVLALVEGTHQSWVGKKTLPLGKPSISINVTKSGAETSEEGRCPVSKCRHCRLQTPGSLKQSTILYRWA